MSPSSLPQDFRDILLSLKNFEVRYLVVGAWALGAYGLPRATGDLDIFIEKSVSNSRKMVMALEHFGVPPGELDRDFFARDVLFRMGVPPLQLEVFTMISGVSFEAAYQNRESLKFDNLEVPCISLRDLLKNKRASGRAKDQLDVEIILQRFPALRSEL